MSLLELRIDNVRCIEQAELELHPGQSLIWGDNGSGKTSLLEAIFLLGRGRSFRTRNSERLIRHGRERLVVFGRAADNPFVADGPDSEYKSSVGAATSGSSSHDVGAAFAGNLSATDFTSDFSNIALAQSGLGDA